MRHAEPPEPRSSRSHSRSSTFLIGQNSHGQWVVQDQRHRRGGLFISRNEALRFALFENGNQPQAVIMVPGVLELDMTGQAGSAATPAFDTEAPLRRVA